MKKRPLRFLFGIVLGPYVTSDASVPRASASASASTSTHGFIVNVNRRINKGNDNIIGITKQKNRITAWHYTSSLHVNCKRGQKVRQSKIVRQMIKNNNFLSNLQDHNIQQVTFVTGAGKHEVQSTIPSSVLRSSSSGSNAEYNSNMQHAKKDDIATTMAPVPISSKFWPERFPAKELCSKCGLCETTFVSQVKESCAFLGDGMSRMDTTLEQYAHGRRRSLNDMVWSSTSSDIDDKQTKDFVPNNVEMAEEARFGVMVQPMQLVRGIGMQGAQWTGAVTSIAIAMLESNMVDAVICIASNSYDDNDDNDEGNSWSEPKPIIARTVEDVLRGRGVKPCLAPSLAVLDDVMKMAKEHGDLPPIKNLLFCGVGCAVQAFRAIQPTLEQHLDNIYVMGTNCADNSPTPEAARDFLQEGGLNLSENEMKRIRGYEFMQDFKVHVKLSSSLSLTKKNNDKNDEEVYYKKLPYFCLDGTIAEKAIAKSCLSCFDYTNGLADVVIGYMAAPLDSGGESSMTKALQSLTIRNERGKKMVNVSLRANRLEIVRQATGKGTHESISLATVQSDNIVQALLPDGKVNSNGMPLMFGEVMSFLMTNFIGPKELAFARYSIDYHLLRNYLYILHRWEGNKSRAYEFIPQYAKDIVEHYLDQNQSFKELEESIIGKEV